jgi:succinate-semialdehyde dehydrogenase / glutarate-semialdehyde dehydrogenase
MAIASVNPATGERLRMFPPDDDATIEQKLAAAAARFRTWRRAPFADRAQRMRRAAELLEAEAAPLGRLATLEMGKPLRAARDEVMKSAKGCRFYAEHAEAFMRAEPYPSDATDSYVMYQPLGAVLAIMPWNFPFWQVFRFVAPALMAGNTGVLKHASNVPQCALAIEDLLRRAGFPEGCFHTLLVESAGVERLIADPRIAAVTLTGSTAAGRAVGAAAGRHLKKSVLELGGSDPFVVMPSADLDAAVGAAVAARCVNNGQSCIAAKRFIVHRAIAAAFESRFVAAMGRVRMGDPLDDTTELGPLSSASIRQELHEQVLATVRSGARLLLGGTIPEGPGSYYPTTVLADVPPGSPGYDDELFGPVASLMVATDIDDALRLANDTPFGLGASVWTTHTDEQARLTAGIDAGMVFVNGLVASDPRLPFGGVKRSGYGRELGPHGLREFTNVKTVWVGPRR